MTVSHLNCEIPRSSLLCYCWVCGIWTAAGDSQHTSTRVSSSAHLLLHKHKNPGTSTPPPTAKQKHTSLVSAHQLLQHKHKHTALVSHQHTVHLVHLSPVRTLPLFLLLHNQHLVQAHKCSVWGYKSSSLNWTGRCIKMRLLISYITHLSTHPTFPRSSCCTLSKCKYASVQGQV